MTCHVLRLNCKLVTGYKGSRAAALAVANGEMDAMYVSETSAFKYVKGKNARATVESLGRIFMLPPSTPDKLTKIMRDATHRILSDPKVVAEGDKRNRYIKYVDAAQTEKNIATVLKSLTPEQTAEIRQVVLGK